MNVPCFKCGAARGCRHRDYRPAVLVIPALAKTAPAPLTPSHTKDATA